MLKFVLLAQPAITKRCNMGKISLADKSADLRRQNKNIFKIGTMRTLTKRNKNVKINLSD